jgi:hypothetical protein
VLENRPPFVALHEGGSIGFSIPENREVSRDSDLMRGKNVVAEYFVRQETAQIAEDQVDIAKAPEVVAGDAVLVQVPIGRFDVA